MFVPWCRRRLRIRLNPYSTGSNSNGFWGGYANQDEVCLNPYSTGSNSNLNGAIYGVIIKIVLILILLEVTQISKFFEKAQELAVLILILLEVTQIEK